MRTCPRCGRAHHGHDSEVCEWCWEDLGQMALWEDADEDYDPPIDSCFDREEEARGYQ